MSRDRFKYWQYSSFTVNITPGRGTGYSLEIALRLRFIISSGLFRSEERISWNRCIRAETEYLPASRNHEDLYVYITGILRTLNGNLPYLQNNRSK